MRFRLNVRPAGNKNDWLKASATHGPVEFQYQSQAITEARRRQACGDGHFCDYLIRDSEGIHRDEVLLWANRQKQSFRIETNRPGTDEPWILASNSKVGGNAVDYPDLDSALEALFAKRRKWPGETMRLTVDGVPYDETHTDTTNGVPNTALAAEKRNTIMQLKQTLTVKRKTLQKKIEAHVEELRAAHNERVENARKARELTTQHLFTLLGANPEGVVDMISNDWDIVDMLLVDMVNGLTSDEKAVETVKGWTIGGFGEFQVPTDTRKLLSVLDAAENDTLEVSAEDDLYRYL